MDFTGDLSSFQGAIVACDSIHAFSKITARGGNEKKIESVSKQIHKFLTENGFLKSNLDENDRLRLQKFAYYLVLNADLEVLNELVAMDGVGSVIWTIPTIPKCLLSELLWGLHMDTFIFELIVYSFPQLSLQLEDILIDHFKYFQPTECLKKLEILVSACYLFIFRLVFFNTTHTEVTQAVNNFHTCLKYFYQPPNARKLEILRKDDKYKYVGNNLYALLLTINNCFKEYLKIHKQKLSSAHTIYELSYIEGSLNNIEEFHAKNVCNKDINEAIENCNIALLDTCKDLVMEVSVEIFCAWSEFEENGKSMQLHVGEICFQVENNLKNLYNVCEHPVVAMLGQISSKPVGCIDIINDLDTDTIVNNITNDTEKSKWIKALIHKEGLCNETILIEILTSNITDLNNEECCKLFKICKTHIIEMVPQHQHFLLLLKAFEHCDTVTKFDLLDEHFSDLTFNDSLLSPQFNNMITEIFNKLTISKNVDLSDVLSVFLQSPKQFYSKIYHIASENKQQTEIMVKVIKYLEKFTNHYYRDEIEPCLLIVTKNLMESSKEVEKIDTIVKFVCDLKIAGIIPGSKLLLYVIMPTLHQSLLSRNIMCINMQLKLLLDAFAVNEFIEYRAPLLAMLAQVLDTVRWKIRTFVSLAPATLQIGLQLITPILETYPQQIPDKEKTWLRMKLKNIDPINMFYYRKLWNPPGDTFLEVITGVHIHKDMDVEQLTMRLSQVLCSTTLQEWNEVWYSLAVFSNKVIYNMFHEALLLIVMAESNHHTQDTWSCILHCFKNFVHISRYFYLHEPLDKTQIQDVMQKVILLENFSDEKNIEHFLNIILPLFGYMIEKNKLDISCLWNSLNNKVKNKLFLDFLNNNIFGRTNGDL